MVGKKASSLRRGQKTLDVFRSGHKTGRSKSADDTADEDNTRRAESSATREDQDLKENFFSGTDSEYSEDYSAADSPDGVSSHDPQDLRDYDEHDDGLKKGVGCIIRPASVAPDDNMDSDAMTSSDITGATIPATPTGKLDAVFPPARGSPGKATVNDNRRNVAAVVMR